MPATGATLRQVVYDFMTTFKQVYDDAPITPFQMTYWVLIHADRLRKQHIQKIDSGEYVSVFDVNVSTDSDGLKQITLPSRIYDMDMDKGVSFIAYQKLVGETTPRYIRQTFSRTTASQAKRLFYRSEEAPSPDNPYFLRLGDVLKLLGIELVTVSSVEVGLYTSLDPNDINMDLDQEFDFPQDLLPMLERQVLEIGLLALKLPKDLNNDGTGDISQQVPDKKLTSVNDFSSEDNRQQ